MNAGHRVRRDPQREQARTAVVLDPQKVAPATIAVTIGADPGMKLWRSRCLRSPLKPLPCHASQIPT